MSEGYQRRPEQPAITQREWNYHAAVWLLSVLVCVCVMASQRSKIVSLRAENAALARQLDYWTCRVQYEPSPMPEQVGGGPTLLPGEEK